MPRTRSSRKVSKMSCGCSKKRVNRPRRTKRSRSKRSGSKPKRTRAKRSGSKPKRTRRRSRKSHRGGFVRQHSVQQFMTGPSK